jgi:hypothetical protein
MILGAAALALGAFYYTSVRPLAIAAGLTSNDAQRLPVLALALGSLPTLIHVLAFSLLTGAVGTTSAAGRAWTCAVWAAINALFELGQRESVARVLATRLDDWCGNVSVCTRTGQYFMRGTFDFTDIAAGALGGLLAYTILKNTDRRPENLS